MTQIRHGHLTLVWIFFLSITAQADPCGLRVSSSESSQQTSGEIEAASISYGLNDAWPETSGLTTPVNPVQVPILIKKTAPDEKTFEGLINPKYESTNDAGLLLLFRAPSSFSLKDCGENQVTVSSSVANSMVNPKYLNRKDGGYRFQQVDALGETNEVKVEKGDCRSSLTVGLRTYRLMGGPSGNPIGYMVSDKQIEKVHQMMGYQDPYGRDKLGYDQTNVHLRDTQGREFNGQEGKYILLPLRIKYDEYQKLMESENSKVTLNTGGQVLVPLQKPFGQLGAGVHANISETYKINENWLSTVGAGLGVNIQKNILGGYNPTDRKIDVSLNETIAAGLTRVDDNKKGATSFVVAIQSESPLLRRQDYQSPANESFLQQLSAGASMDTENGIVVAVVRQNENSTHSFQCKEDFKGKGWKLNGNNNEDFRCGYSYSRKY